MSRPIVVTACMFGSSESWGPQQHPHPWHFRAGGGAVHSIKSELIHRNKKHLYSIVVGAAERPRFRLTAGYGISVRLPDHSGLMPADLITLAHLSVSSAMSWPKSAGEPASTVPPKSASRALILESAKPALISLLSLSTISAGVFF